MESSGIALGHLTTTDSALVVETNLDVLLHEADAGARRLVRRLDLAAHDRDDVRQELIVDLLIRTKAFNPSRGSLGAFSGVIARHRAAHISNRLHRERSVFINVPSPCGRLRPEDGAHP